MLIVTGKAEITQGYIEQALELANQHVTHSRTEPGCISHSVYTDSKQTNLLFFYEQWESMATLQQHFASATSKTFVHQLSTLCVSEPMLEIFDAEKIR